MKRTQILLEPEIYKKLKRIAKQEKRSFSDLTREMLRDQLALRQRKALSEAAQTLLMDYQADPELTAFASLDGDEFHA